MWNTTGFLVDVLRASGWSVLLCCCRRTHLFCGNVSSLLPLCNQ